MAKSSGGAGRISGTAGRAFGQIGRERGVVDYFAQVEPILPEVEKQ